MEGEFDPVLEALFDDPILDRPPPDEWIETALVAVKPNAELTVLLDPDETTVRAIPARPPSNQRRTPWLAAAAAVALVLLTVSIVSQRSADDSQTVIADAPTSDGTLVTVAPPDPIEETGEGVAVVPERPTACFSPDSAQVYVDETVSFALCTTGEIDRFLWNFGDGTTSTQSVGPVEHTFLSTGDFTVRLEVSGPGGSGSVTADIAVVTNPLLPTNVLCEFSNFFTDPSGVYTWSETWTWTEGQEVAVYGVVENRDGDLVSVFVEESGRHRIDGVTGLPNSGNSIDRIVVSEPDGATIEFPISNCGSFGGTGWVPPNE